MKLLRVLAVAMMLITGMAALAACQTIGSPLEDYKWVLVQYGEAGGIKQVIDGTEVSAFFDSTDKTVTGSGGCNSYSAKYEVEGLTLTIIEPIIRTKISCGGEKDTQENDYLNSLQQAEDFELQQGQLIIHCGQTRLIFNNTKLTVKPPTHWGE